MTAETHDGRDQIRELRSDTVGDLLLGARLFASGGGGTISAATADWLRQVLDEHGPVSLAPPDQLASESLCVAVGLVGSPTLLEEILPTGEEPLRAVRALEQRLGRRVDAVTALDAAGENVVFPVIAAAQLGVPLLDADGMGRIFPLVEQTVFALAGISPTPLGLTCGTGTTVIVDHPTNAVERIVRPIVLSGGGWAMSAGYPMTVERLAHVGIAGSMSRAIHAGDMVRQGESMSGTELARRLAARQLCRGRIIDLEQHRDWDAAEIYPAGPGSITVLESGGLDRAVRLEVHNEVLLALADGAVTAAVPDGICLLSVPDRRVVDVEHVDVGMEIEVLAFPAAPAWKTSEGLELAGPAAFGLDVAEGDVPR